MEEDFGLDDDLDLLDADMSVPTESVPSKPAASAAATIPATSSSSSSSSTAPHAPASIAAPPTTIKPPMSGLAPLAPLKPLGGGSHAPLAPLKPMLPSAAPKPSAVKAAAAAAIDSGSDEDEETKEQEKPSATLPPPAATKHSESDPVKPLSASISAAAATSSTESPSITASSTAAVASKTPLSPLAPLKPASSTSLTPLAPLKPPTSSSSSSSSDPPSSISSPPLVAKAPVTTAATHTSKQASLCENCFSSIATIHCNDCKLNLCQMDCDKELHILISKSKHVRVPIDGISKPVAAAATEKPQDEKQAPKSSAAPKSLLSSSSSIAASIDPAHKMCGVCFSAVPTIYCKDCNLYLCQMDCDKEQHILVSKSKHVRVPYPSSTQAPSSVKPAAAAASSSSSSLPQVQKTSSLPTASDTKKLCSNCFSSIATIYCKDCDMHLCQMDCDKEMHILVSKSKHHRVPFPLITATSADTKPPTASPFAPAKAMPKLSSSSSSASVASAASSSSKILLCDNCLSSTATLHCKECNKNLCESDCDKELHLLVSKSKHLRTPINGAPPSTSSSSSTAIDSSSTKPAAATGAPQDNKRSSKRSSFSFGSSVIETPSIPSSSPAAKPAATFTPMSNISSPSPSPSPPSLSSTMSTSMFSPASQILCDHCCSSVATIFCSECDLRLCQSNCDHELHILVRTAGHKRVPWPLSPGASGHLPLTSPIDERGIRRASAGLEFAKQRNRSRSRSKSPPPRAMTQMEHDGPHGGRKALSSARRASANKNLPPLETGGSSGNTEHDRERELDRARERARRAEAERTAASMSAMRHPHQANTFSPPPPLNVSTPSHQGAHSPSQPTAAKPVEVSVRHKKHAQMMPPAVSPHHASWEDELHHELREDQHPLQNVKHEFKEAEIHQEFRRTSSFSQQKKQQQEQLAEERISGGGTRFPSILRPGVPHSAIDPLASGSQNRPVSAQRAALVAAQKQRAAQQQGQSLQPTQGGSPAMGSIQSSPGKPPRKLNWSPAFVDPQPGESVLTVFTGTWNLHAKPFPDNLSEFIPRDSYDLYVIGTEECENSIEVSMIFTSKEKWTKCLSELLGDGYEEIAQQTLQAIHVIAFIRKSLVPYVHHIEAASVATGIGDVLGNKGGVGLGFDISNTSFLFINSHFAAHQYKVQQRNDDFHKINARMPLKQKLLTQERYAHLTNVCDRFDRVFWLGDLNYRVGGNRAMVDSLISQRMIEVMLHNDQLNQERIHGRVFKGFVEGEITFMPTYKFDNKTDRYDTSKKARIPSYTDRILWRPSTSIELLEYNSVPTVRSSDHRPVFATFKVKVKQHAENEERKRKKYVNGEQPGSRACVIQ